MQRRQEPLRLQAAVLTVHTPLAEVLTVVAQYAVAAFANTRPRTANDLLTSQAIGPWRSDPYRVSVSEACKRNLFHRSPVPVSSEGSIVNDAPGTHVDTVVRVGETRRNEVCAERRLFRCGQSSIAAAKPPHTLTI